jgi:CheY-like chemotaxis protein
MMVQAQDQTVTMMVVEDSDEDFESLNRTIAQVYPRPLQIQRCIDGDDALDFLSREGQYAHLRDVSLPRLVILDLNLPGTDGREVLTAIKTSEILKTIPVIVFSTSSNPKDIQACYQRGSNSYLLKPLRIQDLKDSVRIVLDYWLTATILPEAVKLNAS